MVRWWKVATDKDIEALLAELGELEKHTMPNDWWTIASTALLLLLDCAKSLSIIARKLK